MKKVISKSNICGALFRDLTYWSLCELCDEEEEKEENAYRFEMTLWCINNDNVSFFLDEVFL